MENRPNFVISLLAINKLGAIGVLINTSLTGAPLVHCINTSDSKKCIFGDELSNSLEGVLDEINITNSSDLLWVEDTNSDNCPTWASNIKDGLDQSKSSNLDQTNKVVAGDTAFYIFTSGTTGVPKCIVHGAGGSLIQHKKIKILLLGDSQVGNWNRAIASNQSLINERYQIASLNIDALCYKYLSNDGGIPNYCKASVIKIIEIDNNEPFILLNIGSGVSITIKKLTSLILDISKVKAKTIKYDKSKPSVKTSVSLDCSKAKSLLGWSPKVSLEEGIRKTISWYKEENNI